MSASGYEPREHRRANGAIARGAVVCASLWLCANVASVAHAAPGVATATAPAGKASADKPAATDPIAKYFTELAAMKLVDAESGNLETLRKELGAAEQLLRDGAFVNAAVALFLIVKSPRYTAFTDFVEFQNAEYDLGVSLARAGSYGAALDALEVVLRRGPGAPYWGPAHRRVVDIALETRDHAGVLARLEAINPTGEDPRPAGKAVGVPTPPARLSPSRTADPIPPSAAGERSYLRGRAAYDAGKLADAEGELVLISKQSRLYSSAVYLIRRSSASA